MLELPRIMLAAPASGSGKTMITCGLLEALKERGCRPASFKCGPDYIDPMFHTRVIGMPSHNLDPFFTDQATTRFLFARSAQNAGISVMEGVMGLYDGLGGITPDASSYHLAEITDTPVVLIVNAKGMSLSVVPYIKGFMDYEETARQRIRCEEGGDMARQRIRCEEGRDMAYHSGNDCDCDHRLICGVILNRVTEMTYRLLKPVIEEQTGICVLGYVPPLEACRIESRHLGLVTPGEIADLQQRVQTLARELEKSVDLDALIGLAKKAVDYRPEEAVLPEKIKELKKDVSAGPLRIAVARDEAFCFYYQDNLVLLELLGAQLVPFSPLHDQALPSGVSGLLLGGGYPELYAEKLAENRAMLQQVRKAVSSGMPYLGECGGFMYLHERMQDMEGTSYEMAGVIRGEAFRTPRLGRFGYITLTGGAGQLLPQGQSIRGHEFHYFDSENPGSDYEAVKPVTGRRWQCMHGDASRACGYPHLYYWSNPAFASQFLEQAARYRDAGVTDET